MLQIFRCLFYIHKYDECVHLHMLHFIFLCTLCYTFLFCAEKYEEFARETRGSDKP